MQIFMLYRNQVHIINIPLGYENVAYFYSREKLMVADCEITPWGEVKFVNGVAKFNFNFVH